MEKKFSDIHLIDEYKGIKKGNCFHIPIRCFGKDGTQLYKILGFEQEKDKHTVYAQRINKRSRKVPGNAPILEIFDFDQVFPKS